MPGDVAAAATAAAAVSWSVGEQLPPSVVVDVAAPNAVAVGTTAEDRLLRVGIDVVDFSNLDCLEFSSFLRVTPH